jgi:polysaccharide biosynthesis protein PelC
MTIPSDEEMQMGSRWNLLMLRMTVVAGLAGMVGLMGCAGVQHSVSPAMSCSDKWVLLPFHNYSETPQAGQAVARMVENALRSRGLREVYFYPSSLEDSLGEFSMSHGQYERTLDWAKWQNAVYGVTGSVTEWRYKSGSDGEPAVGITLAVVDIKTGKSIWSASGARTGWSSDPLSGAGLKLVGTLVSKADIRCN